METQMTRELLLATMRNERAGWEALLAQVGAPRMTRPGVAGTWSTKDIIAHITAYERWTAERLEACLHGEQFLPDGGDEGDRDVDTRNQRLYEADRDRPLVEVLAGAPVVFRHLLAVVSRLTDEDLTDPARLGLPPDWTPWKLVAGNSFEHYHQHIPSIRAWLAAQPD